MNKLPEYYVNPDIFSLNIEGISIVEVPAVDKNFFKLSKQDKNNFFLADNHKKIITGVALRAEYPIYRKIGGEEFYIRFSKDAIEKYMWEFMKDPAKFPVNLEHSNNIADGIYLIESFLLNSEHRHAKFFDIEDGSWIVSYKIDNPEVWKMVKSGKFNGFSMELTGNLTQVELMKMAKLYNSLNN